MLEGTDCILLGPLQIIGQLGIKALKCIIKINILWKTITQGKAQDLQTFKCCFERLRLILCIYMIALETGTGISPFPPTHFFVNLRTTGSLIWSQKHRFRPK